MTDTELHEERKPRARRRGHHRRAHRCRLRRPVRLARRVSVGSAAVIATMVLLVGWAALMAVTYGPAPTEAEADRTRSRGRGRAPAGEPRSGAQRGEVRDELLPGGVQAPVRSAGSASRMNTALVVVVVRRVRCTAASSSAGRSLPASSRHTTSPTSGCSITAAPESVVSNGSSPAARTSRAGPT